MGGFNTQFTPYIEKAHAVEGVPPTKTTAAGATQGSAVSIGEWVGNIMVLVNAPLASAGSSPTLTWTVEHRVDSTDSWGAVPAAALINPLSGAAATFAVVTDAANPGAQKLGLVKALCKAQIRLVATVGGTSTPTFVFAGFFIGSDKYGDQ